MGLGLSEPRLPGRSVSRTTPRRRACIGSCGPEARVDLALLATLVAKELDATAQKRAPIMSFLHNTRAPHTRLRILSLSRGQNPRVCWGNHHLLMSAPSFRFPSTLLHTI